jgi:NDP-sugar pyrophosphorylase family protein
LDLIPKDTFYSTVAFFSDLTKRNQLLAFEVKKRFYHIGTPEALEEFNDYIKGLS